MLKWYYAVIALLAYSIPHKYDPEIWHLKWHCSCIWPAGCCWTKAIKHTFKRHCSFAYRAKKKKKVVGHLFFLFIFCHMWCFWKHLVSGFLSCWICEISEGGLLERRAEEREGIEEESESDRDGIRCSAVWVFTQPPCCRAVWFTFAHF